MLNVSNEIFEKMCYSSLFDIIKNYKRNGEVDLTFKELKNLNFDITKKIDLNEAFKEDFNGTGSDLPGDYDEFLTQINEEYQDRRLTAEDILIGLNVLNTKINILFNELSKNINSYSNITFNGEPIVEPELLNKSRNETQLNYVIVNLDEENPTMVTIIRNLLDKLNIIYNDKSNNDYNNTIFKLLFSMSQTLPTNFLKIVLSIFQLFNTNTGPPYIIGINHINSPMILFGFDRKFIKNKLTDEIFDAKKNEYIKQLSNLFDIDEKKMGDIFLDKNLSRSLDISFIPETSNFIISDINTIGSICLIDNEKSDLKETIFLAYILVYKTYNFNENTMTIDIKIRWVINDEDIIRLINYYNKVLNAGINNDFQGIRTDSDRIDIEKTLILLINLYICMLRKKYEYNLEEYLNIVQDFSNDFANDFANKFYDELKVNNDIIPKQKLSFDFNESISISNWVDEKLEKLYIANDFINFDEFINNNNKYFELKDFKKPIFNVLFNILMSDISKYNIYLNDNHILKYDEDMITGNKINTSINDNKWAIEKFIPCLFDIYETSYKQMLSPSEFNLKFFELLYSFSLFIDINTVFDGIITTLNNYNVVSTKLNKTGYQGLLTQAEKYTKKYAKKLSVLFNIQEDKVKKTILNFGTAVINLNSENLIIKNTSTIILSYNENGSLRTDFNINNIIGIILIQNNYNLLTDENQLIFECRWYIPDDNKSIYKSIYDDKQKILIYLQYVQQKITSENYMELQKIGSVCDNTLDMLIDEIKNYRLMLEIVSTSNKNEIKFTKFSKLNFNVIFELGLHEYYKNLYFKKMNGKEEDYDDYLLSISNSCLDENYVFNIMNEKMPIGQRPKIYNCLVSIGKDINGYNEIIVNDEIIFNSKTSKNINGEIIDRNNGFKYIAEEFLPNLFNIYKANYKSDNCKNFNEQYIKLIFSLVQTEIVSFLLVTITQILTDNGEEFFTPLILRGHYLTKEIMTEDGDGYSDVKDIKNIKRIATSFDISVENVNKLIPNVNMRIDITKDNIITKKEWTWGIIMKNNVTDKWSLLGIIIATEIYNLKYNTYNITCQVRWIPNNSLIKQNIFLIKNAYDELSDDEKEEKQENMNKIMSYYKCIYLNGLSPEQIKDINSDSDDSIEWPEIKLNTFEKIKQKLNVSLGSILGGNKTKSKSKKNMKRINKKRVTRNHMKKNTVKKTRKGVKKVKKIRNTKKQLRNS